MSVMEPDVRWWEHAACRGMDTNLFFPERGVDSSEAKRICAGCEVRAECLADALANRDTVGIRGGTSERQRSKMDRAYKVALVAECGTDSGYYRHHDNDEDPCGPCKVAHATKQRRRGLRRR